MPHGQHVPHDVNDTDVNMTSSADHNVAVDDKGDMEMVMNHAGSSMENVWKGLIVVGGIYVFFVTERLISLCQTTGRRSNKVLLLSYFL